MREVPLKESFRRLYSLALDPLDRVVDLFDELGEIWGPRIQINLNDWELDEMGDLFRLLEVIKLDPSLTDGWDWVISKKK